MRPHQAQAFRKFQQQAKCSVVGDIAAGRDRLRRVYDEALCLAAEAARAEDVLIAALQASGAEWTKGRLTDRPWLNRAELLREFDPDPKG
jgi:hypothetical protein